MKIKAVRSDNRRKCFVVAAAGKTYRFPYAKLRLRPSPKDPIAMVCVDDELGKEAFTYTLASGKEDTVHVEQVLDYNRDPRYMRNLLLYKLTLIARERAEKSALSKRELIRRLGTSPAQLYRLLDQKNSTKSIDQMLALLGALECDVDLIVRRSRAPATVSQAGRRAKVPSPSGRGLG